MQSQPSVLGQQMNINKIVAECNPFELPNVLFCDRTNLPKTAGVYFVIVANDIAYIGRSISLHSRWRGSNHDCRLWLDDLEKTVIAWLDLPYTCGDDYEALRLAEVGLIERFNPSLNKLLRKSKAIRQTVKLSPLPPLVPVEPINKELAMRDNIRVLEDSLMTVNPVVDGMTTTELQKRYGLKSRSTLSNRMDALEITARKGTENRRFYVSLEGVKALDDLHKCLEIKGAKLEECAAGIKKQMHNGSSPPETAITPPSSTNTILLQLPDELIQSLRILLEKPTSNWNDYEQLELIASKAWYITTNRLLPLLGRKSIPKLDDHNRFSCMGFTFWQSGKIGNQYQWKVTKTQS